MKGFYRQFNILAFLLMAAVLVPGQETEQTTKEAVYRVGFRVIQAVDYSRSFEGRQGRPVQIAVWYPADTSAQGFKYADYLSLYATEDGSPELSEETRESNLAFWKDELSGRVSSAVDADLLLGHNTKAIREAAPARGKFPVIIYGAGGQGESFENSVLFEQLASSGFIVLASPSQGPYAHKTVIDPVGLEAAARDIEFVLARAADLPGSDLKRIGLMGWSWGGLAALLVQMRNPNVDAVLSLDGSIAMHADKIRKTAFYDPDRIRVPLMLMTTESNLPKVMEFVNEVDYARVYVAEFPAARHTDFSSYNYIAMKFASVLTVEEEKRKKSYELVAGTARSFFKAFLNGPGGAGRFTTISLESPGIVSFTAKDPLPLPPTQEEFFELVLEKGIPEAKKVFAEVRSRDADYQIFEAFEATVLADRLFKAGREADAIEIAKLRVDAYPEDYLSYEWVANLYFKMKDWKNSLAFYGMAYGMARSLEQTPEILSELEFYRNRMEASRSELAKPL